MKRNIVLLLTLALVAGTFVGCGCNTTNENEKTTNEINATVDEEETSNEVSTEDTTTSDSGNVGDITGEEESTEDTSKEVKVGCYYFPTGDGYTEKILATEYDPNADANWSYNKTYFLDCNGNVMTFKWEGPATLSEQAWVSGDTIIMSNAAGECALRAFTTGEETPEGFEEIKSLDKDFIITCTPGDISYIKNGYYNANINNDVAIFSFAIQGPVKANIDGKGYAWLYVNKITGASYQFYYLEKLSNYDDARAWKVVESLAGISVEDFDTDEIKNFVD